MMCAVSDTGRGISRASGCSGQEQNAPLEFARLISNV